jgi:hypothetical protein
LSVAEKHRAAIPRMVGPSHNGNLAAMRWRTRKSAVTF